jgi:glycosyltransferase involved in cell wall biosynthesis
MLFNDVSELPAILKSVNESWQTIASNAARRKAVDEFGWNACSRQYAQFFESVIGHTNAVEKPVTE